MRKKKKCQVIAHRGASALAEHENTLEAFNIAMELKADMVEFDVRRTMDDELVVFHDKQLKGTDIGKLTYGQINDITGKEGYRVPTFAEVLKVCQGRVHLDIELKETGYEKRVVNLVRRYYNYNEYSIKSFLDIVSLKIKEIDNKITTGLLVGTEHTGFKTHIHEYFPEKRLRLCKADFVSPHYKLVTGEFAGRMRRQRIPVYVWTVNDSKTMKKLIHKRVAAIITDRPDVMIELKMKMKMA